jgi:plasmid maintenance system antidote protein VapI
MRALHAEHPVGHPEHLGYRRLAKIFEVPRATVQRLVTGRHRL